MGVCDSSQNGAQNINNHSQPINSSGKYFSNKTQVDQDTLVLNNEYLFLKTKVGLKIII